MSFGVFVADGISNLLAGSLEDGQRLSPKEDLEALGVRPLKGYTQKRFWAWSNLGPGGPPWQAGLGLIFRVQGLAKGSRFGWLGRLTQRGVGDCVRWPSTVRPWQHLACSHALEDSLTLIITACTVTHSKP